MADGEIAGGPQGADDSAPSPGAPAATPPPGNAGPGGPGGNPILAAMAHRQQGPKVSAPGPGDQASSIIMVQNALAMLNQSLAGLQPGTPVHRDVMRAVQSLGRHTAQGAPTAGVQQTQAQDMLRNIVRNALMAKIMGQQQQGAGASDQGGPAPPMPQAPMPSTPLPGA